MVEFFLENVFLNPPKNHKFVTVPRLVKNMQNLATNTLPYFDLLNPHHNNTPVWAQKYNAEGFTSHLRSITLLWVNFQGLGEPPEITKIRFLKIFNYAHFLNSQFHYPVKHQNT